MTHVRTLEFGAEDGLTVTVTVRSPTGKAMRLGAIRSALVNHAYLLPVEDAKEAAAPLRTGWRGYAWCVGVGLLIPLAAFGGLFAVLSRADGAPVPPEFTGLFLQVMLPFFVVLCTGLMVLMEWQNRRFRAKSRLVTALVRGAPGEGAPASAAKHEGMTLARPFGTRG